MKCAITQVNGDGTIRRAVVDTTGRHDAARWERLADQARLDLPPPYRPHPGEPVYEIARTAIASPRWPKAISSAPPPRAGPH